MAATVFPSHARSGGDRQDAVRSGPRAAPQTAHRDRAAAAPTHARSGRILFLNRFFFPDHSATSQMLSDLAFHLARRGIKVGVVTSRQLYDDPNALLPSAETIGGVTIRRVATTRFGRSALLGRAFDYLSFYAAAYRAVLASATPGDVVVAKTDPPLLSVAARHAARRRGCHLVNWLQDLYPEAAAALGVPLVAGPLGHGLRRLRDASLHAASVNVAVGESMAEIVRARGIAAECVRVIPNWCDDVEIRPLGPRDNPLRREWGLCDRFVVGYSGNLGRGHEFDTVLAAAERLRHQPHFCFLFIGGGKRFAELSHAVEARRLGHLFRFLPYQERSLLRFSLGAADVHLVSLRPELEGLIVPSKLYGIAAAGRPIVAVVAADGEVAGLIRRHDCGLVVEPGAGELLAERLEQLRAAPARLTEMGRHARAMLDRGLSRQHAFARWETLLDKLGVFGSAGRIDDDGTPASRLPRSIDRAARPA